MVFFRSALFLLATLQIVRGTEELNADRFEELTKSGKNGMIKFYQPWCGHCTTMKPAWDKAASEAHSSVFVADINCSDQEELCSKEGVQGYPTIKVYKDGSVTDYKGGRSAEELIEYVDQELAAKCDVKDAANSGCSEKAIAYIQKWTDKDDAAAAKKELDRLTGMLKSSMKADLKQWLSERINILNQLGSKSGDEL